MQQRIEELGFPTNGQGLYDLTASVVEWVARQGIDRGLLTVYIRHTSASLLIQENADHEVTRDLNDFFSRLVPQDNRLYRHTYEGVDDMPAHIRAALTQTHLSIPVMGGKPSLGTWQAVFLFEHRGAPNERKVVLHLLGE
ncbi:YjbQ family protein [Candidatus Poribacteria bacterium]|nr:YjbQ family protein [Candidatus Poribacteria bacterium]